jgi:hypothetical protein
MQPIPTLPSRHMSLHLPPHGKEAISTATVVRRSPRLPTKDAFPGIGAPSTAASPATARQLERRAACWMQCRRGNPEADRLGSIPAVADAISPGSLPEPAPAAKHRHAARPKRPWAVHPEPGPARECGTDGPQTDGPLWSIRPKFHAGTLAPPLTNSVGCSEFRDDKLL